MTPPFGTDADYDAMAEHVRAMRGIMLGVLVGSLGWGLLLGLVYAIWWR